MNRRSCMIRIAWLAGLLSVWASPGWGQVRGVELEVLKARLESIQNLSVEYVLTEEFSPPEEIRQNPVIDLGDGFKVVAKVKPKTGRALFRFLYGKARYEWELDEAMLAEAGDSDSKRYVHVDSGSRVDRLTIDVSGSQNGMIDDASPLPGNMIVDVALGLRAHDAEDWLEPDSLDRMERASQDDGLLRLEAPDANIPTRKHLWFFDPDLGYALVRYQVVSPDRLTIDLQNSKFETVENVKLPRTIAWKRYRYDEQGKRIESMRKEATVHRYVLGDPDNTPESYVMIWPVNTSVLDARTDTPIAVTSGDRTLDDEWLKEAAARYSRGVVAGENHERPPQKAAWPRRWLLIANMAALAGLIVYLCYRRARYGAKS